MRLVFSAFAIALFAFSCSSDSSDNPDTTNAGDYFPLNMDNSWTYDVTNNSPTNPEFNYTETDVVTINTLSGNTFTVDVNAPTDNAFGTANTIFNSGSMTRTDTNLTFTGEVGLFSELESVSNATIPLSNFVVYDTNASNNSVIDSTSDTFTQNEDFNGLEVPVTTSYTITSTNLSSLNSFTVNGTAYDTVIHTQIIVNITVTALINLGNGINSSVNILSPQDALVINNYFAKDIGLVKSTANQSFIIDSAFIQALNLLNIPIDFETQGSATNTQDINNYTVN